MPVTLAEEKTSPLPSATGGISVTGPATSILASATRSDGVPPPWVPPQMVLPAPWKEVQVELFVELLVSGHRRQVVVNWPANCSLAEGLAELLTREMPLAVLPADLLAECGGRTWMLITPAGDLASLPEPRVLRLIHGDGRPFDLGPACRRDHVGDEEDSGTGPRPTSGDGTLPGWAGAQRSANKPAKRCKADLLTERVQAELADADIIEIPDNDSVTAAAAPHKPLAPVQQVETARQPSPQRGEGEVMRLTTPKPAPDTAQFPRPRVPAAGGPAQPPASAVHANRSAITGHPPPRAAVPTAVPVCPPAPPIPEPQTAAAAEHSPMLFRFPDAVRSEPEESNRLLRSETAPRSAAAGPSGDTSGFASASPLVGSHPPWHDTGVNRAESHGHFPHQPTEDQHGLRTKDTNPREESQLRRRASVRWFKQMNPDQMFPLTVVLSKARIKAVTVAHVGHAYSEQQLLIPASYPYVRIKPVMPGCQVFPEEHTVDVTPDVATARFQVLPLLVGEIPDARVELYWKDRKLSDIGLPTRVTKQLVAGVLATAAATWPFLSSGLGNDSSKASLVSTLAYVLSLPCITELILVGVAMGAIVSYLRNLPQESSEETDVLAVKQMTVPELIAAAEKAMREGRYPEAVGLLEDARNLSPNNHAVEGLMARARRHTQRVG